MDKIKGITFIGENRGRFAGKEAKKSLFQMKEQTGCNTLMLFIGGLQSSPQSENIDYRYNLAPSDSEVEEFIRYAVEIGLMVMVKPVVSCKDGTWRAHINFFDKDIPCEPKWCNWFESYTKFQVHYAEIAEKTGCEFFCIGSEMVMAERRTEEWKALIKEVRKVYSGQITYIADKYQEDNVAWWSELDIITAGGAYPIDTWEKELDRLEILAHKYKKPFMIGDLGCKSCKGSSKLPNFWEYQGEVDMEEQIRYFKAVFEACEKRDFIDGVSIWDWNYHQYKEEDALKDRSYSIFGKPICDYLKEKWQ